MAIGPVEYVIVGFPGNNFSGAIAPALAELIETNTIRILDLIFVAKDADGETAAIEFDELEALAAFGELEGEVGGLITADDIAHAAASLEPSSSAALLIWEDVWASEFASAVRESGGVLVEGAENPSRSGRSRVRGPPRVNLTDHDQGGRHASSPTNRPYRRSNRRGGRDCHRRRRRRFASSAAAIRRAGSSCHAASRGRE